VDVVACNATYGTDVNECLSAHMKGVMFFQLPRFSRCFYALSVLDNELDARSRHNLARYEDL
jgi:hypothetical protein